MWLTIKLYPLKIDGTKDYQQKDWIVTSSAEFKPPFSWWMLKVGHWDLIVCPNSK